MNIRHPLEHQPKKTRGPGYIKAEGISSIALYYWACSPEVTVTSISHPSFVSHRGILSTNHRFSPTTNAHHFMSLSLTSGRIHGELLRLLFILADKKTTLSFQTMGEP